MHLKSFPEHSLTGYFLPFHYNHNTDSLVAKKKNKNPTKKTQPKKPPQNKKTHQPQNNHKQKTKKPQTCI